MSRKQLRRLAANLRTLNDSGAPQLGSINSTGFFAEMAEIVERMAEARK